jgi:hypothetical protein
LERSRLSSLFLALAPETTATVDPLARHLFDPLDLPKHLDVIDERANGLEHRLTPFRRCADGVNIQKPSAGVNLFFLFFYVLFLLDTRNQVCYTERAAAPERGGSIIAQSSPPVKVFVCLFFYTMSEPITQNATIAYAIAMPTMMFPLVSFAIVFIPEH